MKVVRKSVLLFDFTSGKYLYGFYDEKSYESHMKEWQHSENFDCIAEEIPPETATYLRDHCSKDEFKTDSYVMYELED